MKWRRVFVATGGILLATTAAALCAASGWAVDAPINEGISLLSKGVGPFMIAAGCAGWAGHTLMGRDMGVLGEHAGKMCLGGAACMSPIPIMTLLGGTAGALIHLIGG